MAVAGTQPSATYSPLLLAAAGAVGAVSLVGAAIAVTSRLSPSLLDALGPTGWLSVPLPMMAIQVVLGALAGLRQRAVAAAAAALLGTACTLAVVSGFFDGAYVDAPLSGGQRAYQMLLVASLVALAVTAFVRFRRVCQRRR